MAAEILTSYQEIILIDEAYLTSLIADIEKAINTIDMEMYIFEGKLIGKKIADVLCTAARRGVKIRILVDGIGSFLWGNSITTHMEMAGITTRIFHPMPLFIWHWGRASDGPKSFFSKVFYLFSKINTRNHRKLCIIDSNIVYVGSANITDHLSNETSQKPWRDTTVKLINVDTKDLQYAFEKAWGHIAFKNRIRTTFRKIQADPLFRLNYSWRRRHILYKTLLKRISRCETKIWVTNSYFAPDNRLLSKLIKASKRGVDVRILLPQKSDVLVSSFAASTFYAVLIKNGVLIYEYLPTMLHAKTLILDDWHSVGSSNLNYRSLRHDLEVDVNIRTPEAKQILEKQFLNDIAQSKQVSIDDINNQSFFKKIIGRLSLIFRYWI